MAFQVYRSLEEWRRSFGAASQRTVVTIGNFDGVHLGHQKILGGVVERARTTDALAVAVTFDPHPLRVLRPKTAPRLIQTLRQRLEGLEQLGVAAGLVLEFDRALSRLSPQKFVERILVEAMRVSAVLVGPNFRFGYRQAGDVRRLEELGKQFGFAVETVPAVVVRGEVVSSSVIRQAISEGRMEHAGRLLGRPFSLSGRIRLGTGQGRRLVVPTLNLACEQELIPRKGVYATETVVAGRLYRSATNVGLRPTFDGRNLAVESHLFDFSEDLTAGLMEVRFWKRLRDEKRFASAAALRAQIQRDLERTRSFFSRLDARHRLARARVTAAMRVRSLA